jgi:hypothetical protein
MPEAMSAEPFALSVNNELKALVPIRVWDSKKRKNRGKGKY